MSELDDDNIELVVVSIRRLQNVVL